MYLGRKVAAITGAMLLTLTPAPGGTGQSVSREPARGESFEPIEFIRRFKIGMSYSEIQQALPKNSEQDILSYIVSENVFILSVDILSQDKWSASFTFDTLDSPMRRPERLIELRCSAMLSSHSEPFESIVGKVSQTLGEPIKVERTRGGQEAGWAFSAGSVLILEYSTVPGGSISPDAVVDFVIRSNKRRETNQRQVVA